MFEKLKNLIRILCLITLLFCTVPQINAQVRSQSLSEYLPRRLWLNIGAINGQQPYLANTDYLQYISQMAVFLKADYWILDRININFYQDIDKEVPGFVGNFKRLNPTTRIGTEIVYAYYADDATINIFLAKLFVQNEIFKVTHTRVPTTKHNFFALRGGYQTDIFKSDVYCGLSYTHYKFAKIYGEGFGLRKTKRYVKLSADVIINTMTSRIMEENFALNDIPLKKVGYRANFMFLPQNWLFFMAEIGKNTLINYSLGAGITITPSFKR